ncbi:hypothetical protein ACFXPA_04745 [Amycolatopsis sp. NPDC059090]|uniref:hypothetical protein n=1 Tax=unclassified Amycolatopsis TaxID=2618356 RepID=UPI003670D72B
MDSVAGGSASGAARSCSVESRLIAVRKNVVATIEQGSCASSTTIPTQPADSALATPGRSSGGTNFCRHTTESAAIAAHLERPPQTRHPLAVYGTVRDISTAHSGNTHQFRDEHEGDLDHARERRRLRIVVRSKNVGTFTGVRSGDRCLGYGHWRLWLAPRAPIAEIQLWIDGPWSLVTWR